MAVAEQEKTHRRPKVVESAFELPDGTHSVFTRARPERLINARPVILAPGFGESAHSFKESTEEMALRGYDTFSFTHNNALNDAFVSAQLAKEITLARIRFSQSASPEQMVELTQLLKSLPPTEFRKALALKAVIEKGTRPAGYNGMVDAVGHSQGGVYVLLAAFLWPHLFNRIILLNPAGQNGPLTYDELSTRFHIELLKKLHKLKMLKVQLSTIGHILTHDGYSKTGRAVREATVLASFNSYPYLAALKVIAPHIKVVTIFDTKDKIFKAEEIKAEEARQKKILGVQDFGQRVEINTTGHYGLVEEPERFAELFDRLVS